MLALLILHFSLTVYMLIVKVAVLGNIADEFVLFLPVLVVEDRKGEWAQAVVVEVLVPFDSVHLWVVQHLQRDLGLPDLKSLEWNF